MCTVDLGGGGGGHIVRLAGSGLLELNIYPWVLKISQSISVSFSLSPSLFLCLCVFLSACLHINLFVSFSFYLSAPLPPHLPPSPLPPPPPPPGGSSLVWQSKWSKTKDFKRGSIFNPALIKRDHCRVIATSAHSMHFAQGLFSKRASRVSGAGIEGKPAAFALASLLTTWGSLGTPRA